MSKGKTSIDLINGPLYKSIIKFCIPIVISNALHNAYTLIDSIVVGRLLGTEALAAVTIGSDIMLLVTLASSGLCTGAQVLIAKYVGKGDQKNVRRSVGTLLGLFMLMAFCCTVLLLFLSRPMLSWLNTPDESWKAAWIYSVTCYCGLVGAFGYNVSGAILRGLGNSKGPLLIVAISSVTNLVLDVLLIAGFDMGVFGAAFATVLAQMISYILALIYIYRHNKQFGLVFKIGEFIPDRYISIHFFKLGIPMMLQQVWVQAATLYVNSFIFAFGAVVTSVNGIGNRLSSIAMIITNSLSRASSVFTAQNLSAGKIVRIKKMYIYNFICSFSFVIILSIITAVFRIPIFRLFVQNEAVLEMSKKYLPILIIKYFAFASRGSNLGFINGVGKPQLNLIIGLVDGLVLRVGLSLLLGAWFGLYGYLYGLSLGGFSSLLIGVPYYFFGKWQKESCVPE